MSFNSNINPSNLIKAINDLGNNDFLTIKSKRDLRTGTPLQGSGLYSMHSLSSGTCPNDERSQIEKKILDILKTTEPPGDLSFEQLNKFKEKIISLHLNPTNLSNHIDQLYVSQILSKLTETDFDITTVGYKGKTASDVCLEFINNNIDYFSNSNLKEVDKENLKKLKIKIDKAWPNLKNDFTILSQIVSGFDFNANPNENYLLNTYATLDPNKLKELDEKGTIFLFLSTVKDKFITQNDLSNLNLLRENYGKLENPHVEVIELINNHIRRLNPSPTLSMDSTPAVSTNEPALVTSPKSSLVDESRAEEGPLTEKVKKSSEFKRFTADDFKDSQLDKALIKYCGVYIEKENIDQISLMDLSLKQLTRALTKILTIPQDDKSSISQEEIRNLITYRFQDKEPPDLSSLETIVLQFPSQAGQFLIKFTQAELTDIKEFQSFNFNILQDRLKVMVLEKKPLYTQELLNYAISTHANLTPNNKTTLLKMLSRFPVRQSGELDLTAPVKQSLTTPTSSSASAASEFSIGAVEVAHNQPYTPSTHQLNPLLLNLLRSANKINFQEQNTAEFKKTLKWIVETTKVNSSLKISKEDIINLIITYEDSNINIIKQSTSDEFRAIANQFQSQDVLSSRVLDRSDSLLDKPKIDESVKKAAQSSLHDLLTSLQQQLPKLEISHFIGKLKEISKQNQEQTLPPISQEEIHKIIEDYKTTKKYRDGQHQFIEGDIDGEISLIMLETEFPSLSGSTPKASDKVAPNLQSPGSLASDPLRPVSAAVLINSDSQLELFKKMSFTQLEDVINRSDSSLTETLMQAIDDHPTLSSDYKTHLFDKLLLKEALVIEPLKPSYSNSISQPIYTVEELKTMNYENLLKAIKATDYRTNEIFMNAIFENKNLNISMSETLTQEVLKRTDDRAVDINDTSSSPTNPYSQEKLQKMNLAELTLAIYASNPSQYNLLNSFIENMGQSDLKNKARAVLNEIKDLKTLDFATLRDLIPLTRFHEGIRSCNHDFDQILIDSIKNSTILSLPNKIDLINIILDSKRFPSHPDFSIISSKRKEIISQIEHATYESISIKINSRDFDIQILCSQIREIRIPQLRTALFHNLFELITYDQFLTALRTNSFMLPKDDIQSMIYENDSLIENIQNYEQSQQQIILDELEKIPSEKDLLDFAEIKRNVSTNIKPGKPISFFQIEDRFNSNFTKNLERLKTGGFSKELETQIAITNPLDLQTERTSNSSSSSSRAPSEITSRKTTLNITLPPLTELIKIKGDGACYYRSLMSGLFLQCAAKDEQTRKENFSQLLLKLQPVLNLINQDSDELLKIQSTLFMDTLRLSSLGDSWNTPQDFTTSINTNQDLDQGMIALARYALIHVSTLNENVIFGELSLKDAILPSYEVDGITTMSEFYTQVIKKMDRDAESGLLQLGLLPQYLGCNTLSIAWDDSQKDPIITGNINETSIATVFLFNRNNHYDLLLSKDQEDAINTANAE